MTASDYLVWCFTKRYIMQEWLQQVYLGNKVIDYLFVAGGMLLAWAVLWLLKTRVITLLRKWAARSTTNFDDLLITAVAKFVFPYLYLLVNYMIITQLVLPARLDRILDVAMIFITTYYVVRLINFLICGGIQFYMERKGEGPARIQQLNGILLVAKALVWILGIIMLIDNLGYDVTTIIAGLGVGGIAIALAAQNILGDLFSYLVIFFDKPFEVGDYIVVGNNSGTVEKIGIKTSHVRSLDGQQLVMPNAEMVKQVIQNHKRLRRRRTVLRIGVVYQTEAGVLKQIPGMIHHIIEQYDNITFDRAHLVGFGDSSLDFEIVYFIETDDFLAHMNTQQSILLSIIEKFEKEGIEFALPTQKIIAGNKKMAEID